MLCMDAVQKDRMGANVAAAQFGVPPSTLHNCLSGQVVHGTNPGPVPYLTRSEESELVKISSFFFKDWVWKDTPTGHEKAA